MGTGQVDPRTREALHLAGGYARCYEPDPDAAVDRRL
jgi:hypothetical protein